MVEILQVYSNNRLILSSLPLSSANTTCWGKNCLILQNLCHKAEWGTRIIVEMKHSPTDDWTVVSDRYEVQSTEELQSISQAFGIGKKEQFAFWTNPMIDSTETKPTNRVTLSIWFWKDLIVRYYFQSTNLYKTWIDHSIPISISDATKIIRKTLTLFHFMILGCVENQFYVL